MSSRSEKASSPASSSKRRRRSDGYATSKRKKHLYLILDDWKDGYSIHKLDPDDMDLSGHLSEPAALRLGAPALGWMAFTALGTNIFVDTNRLRRGSHASPTFVYNTENSALTLGPCVPGDVDDLRIAMAVGEKLYAVMSWAPVTKVQPGDPSMDWSWNSLSTPMPTPINGAEIMDTQCSCPQKDETHSFDTSHGVWKKVGDWVLPFRGQAYFDADLDAWVGIHNKDDGHICCCPVASRCSTTTTPRLERRMLKEKLFRSMEEVK
ncbi:hypothetical protein HU200_051856 [Digitaria exilis]|uniref:Uncharacterized protein n=1 Tax=Digitaria exilis TaxID=1010633 RepID=A0A835E9Q9_9POAL|nr:hypothetical protein HU200_051856 [Digitaria exilis]